jgi:hypothetical protein
MATPDFKVYSAGGEYVAACKYAEEAAALVALRGEGATVRVRHRWTVWTEGREAIPAGESYDLAAECMVARADTIEQSFRECNVLGLRRKAEIAFIRKAIAGVSARVPVGPTGEPHGPTTAEVRA